MAYLKVKDRAMLKLNRYQYQSMGEETGWEWEPVKGEGLTRMVRMLASSYMDVRAIVNAMQDGMTGHTPFCKFRAVPIDDDIG